MDLYKIIKLKVNEEILLVVRQSFIPQGYKFILSFIFLLIPFFLSFPLFSKGIVGIIVFFLLLLLALYLFFRIFIRWSNTILIITDQRIIDIDQKGLFNQVVSEIFFDQIDDVVYQIKGFWSTVFRYGKIDIKLKEGIDDLQFIFLKKPARVHFLIQDLRKLSQEKIIGLDEEKKNNLRKRISLDRLEEKSHNFYHRKRISKLNRKYSED